MQKRALCFLELLIILLFGASTVVGDDPRITPIHAQSDQSIVSLTKEAVTVPAENTSVPRNQVLLEIFTGTW